MARAGTRRRPSGKALYGFFCARLKPTRNRGASLSLSRRSAHLNQPLNKDAASNARQRRRAETRTRGNNRLLAELTPRVGLGGGGAEAKKPRVPKRLLGNKGGLQVIRAKLPYAGGGEKCAVAHPLGGEAAGAAA